MQDSTSEARHRLLNKLVTMAEAALMACLQTRGGPPSKISEQELNTMADVLAGLVTVFSAADDRATLTPLTKDQLKGGTFSDSGRIIKFVDGRPPISDLIITRTAFKTALEILKDAGYR